MEIKLVSDKEYSKFILKVLQAECDERNMTIEEYMIDYLLSKHGKEFGAHVDDLILKHIFEL